MVKSELIQKLAERGNISKTLAETVVNLIFTSMVQELKEEKVAITGPRYQLNYVTK